MQGDAAQVAKRLNESTRTVESWMRGQRIPILRRRAHIEATLGEPRAAWWDEPPATTGATVVDAAELLASATEAEPDDPRAVAAQLAGRVRLVLAQLDASGATVDPTAASRIYDRLARTLAQLGRFDGTALTERQVIHAPASRRCIDAILTALEPWPDAMRAAASALRALENQDQ
jgi:transcriptional regulator with XRE-family HTH domain